MKRDERTIMQALRFMILSKFNLMTEKNYNQF